MAGSREPTGSDQTVPDGWQRVRLGDVAEVQTGGTPSRSEPAYWGGNIPWMASGEISQRRLKSTAEQITQEGLDNSNAKLFPPGTVMVAMNGQGTTRGKACVIGIAASCNQSLAAMLAGENATDPFLFHVLDTAYHQLRDITGDGRSGLNLELIRGFKLLLPPLPEQRAISAVLDSIDDAIEGAEVVIAATEDLRDALLHDLLTRGLPGQHTEFRDVPGLGTIPADWDVVRLGDVLESTTYGTNSPLSAEGAIPVLRMNNILNGQIDLSDVRRADLNEKEARELDLAMGDILFNRTNSLDLVGKVGVVRSLPQPMSFASYLVRLRVKEEKANPFWLSALLWSDDFQARIRKFATPGVSQANINPTSLKTLTISLPTLAEQRAIAAMLDGVDAAIEVAREERGRLRLLKESAADALLSGRVRIGTSDCPIVMGTQGSLNAMPSFRGQQEGHGERQIVS